MPLPPLVKAWISMFWVLLIAAWNQERDLALSHLARWEPFPAVYMFRQEYLHKECWSLRKRLRESDRVKNDQSDLVVLEEIYHILQTRLWNDRISITHLHGLPAWDVFWPHPPPAPVVFSFFKILTAAALHPHKSTPWCMVLSCSLRTYQWIPEFVSAHHSE